MKKNLRYIAVALVAGVTITACSPDDFTGANPNDKATTEGIDVTVEVDQATNEVTMSVPHLVQAYPYWNIPAVRDGETGFYSTLEKTTKVFALAGDKDIIFRVGNSNGFSDGAIQKTIHIDNSLKDLEGLAKAIATADGKQWRVAKEEEAHFGYGPNGSDGSGTWVAEADNKEELALYDDFIKFFTGSSNGNFLYTGKMSYNPGKDGEVQFGGVNENDKRVATAQDDRDYKISVVGDDVLLTLAPDTKMPFVPSDAFLANPVFRIDAYSSGLLVLVANDGDKAWRLVLTSQDFGGGDLGWTGFTNGVNLLEGLDVDFRFRMAGESWDDVINETTQNGNLSDAFSFKMLKTGTEQWKAQLHIEKTNVVLSADKTYDFSIVITSDADDSFEATVKPQAAENNDVFFSTDKHTIVNGANVISLSECAGFDGEFKIALDFAGAPEGTNITISKIFLSEHNDANVVPFDYNDPANIWKTEIEANDAYKMSYWWTDANWQQIADPKFEVKKQKKGSNLYTVTAPAATSSQWQAQTTFVTNMTATMSDIVDFSCIIVPNVDLSGVTVKLTEANDDDGTLHDSNYFFAERVDLKADVPNVVKFTDTVLPSNDAHALDLVFDFGGNPEDAVIKITDIVLIKKQQ